MKTNQIDAIKKILLRDLTSLEKEMNAYKQEEDIWAIDRNIKNSAGNLALHICGNLQHFVGATIGKDGYIREREKEFNAKHISTADLLDEIQSTKIAIENAMQSIDDENLGETYPLEVFGEPMTFAYFLTHLSGHLMYHLGQINYHRRLLAS